MLESKFLFVAKTLFLAFIIINIPNLVPFNLNETSYWIVIFTTIFETATLLVLSSSISKYINLRNMNLTKDLHTKDIDNKTILERIGILQTKIIQGRKVSFILFIFFLISTLLQPIILIFEINKSDIYSTLVIESINREFNNKKNNIEEIISIQKKQITNETEINKLQNSINDLSSIRDKNIEQFFKSNTKNKFNISKIIIRNIILGVLWAFVFYKLYSI